MRKKSIYFLMILLVGYSSSAQVFTNKQVGEKNKDIVDSLKASEYPYILPILGKKATAAGFDLPYSAGLSLNYLWQESAISISNLQVGINGSELYNLDEIVRFNDATATSTGLNIRPDIWLFPFLNIYGILANSKTSTEVDFGVYIPNQTGYEEIFSYRTKAEFEATSFGFGMTPTIGVGGGWVALDMNISWTDIPELNKPAFAFIFGPRVGKSFLLKKPDRTINFWVGGFRIHLSSDTQGNIALKDVLPDDGDLSGRIDNAQVRVNEKQQEVEQWWNDLSPAEQRLNQPKYDALNATLGFANSMLFRLEDATSNISAATIQYSLDKKQKHLWNFIVGSQFQLNKHWMVRAEYGFLGGRNQLITGLQYRFGL
jgi:opacity protein-like surface antigen